jgi:VWFA-related protein
LVFALGITFDGRTDATLDAQAASRERTLFVSAVDDKGEPVENLRPEDFVVREDGQRREVLRVSRATEPLDIALLVDNSTTADDAIVPMREGLKAFIAKMAGPHQIAIIALADRPTIFVDYTTDRARLEGGIGRIFAQQQSGTTLLDGIVEVAQGLEKRESARAVIVPIVTDGVEFTNRYSRDVRDALSRAQVGLHAITIGTFYLTRDDLDVERERELVLSVGTKDSGGQRMTLLSPLGIDQTLAKLAAELSAQYKIVYVRPESLIPPEKIETASARAGVTMRATPMRGQRGA